MIAERASAIDILKEQVAGFGGDASQPLLLDGEGIGSFYDDGMAGYCYIAPIRPLDMSLSRAEQTESVFEYMVSALAACDMEFTDIVRTWFYLDGLLDWYDEFNGVRTAFFQKHGTFGHLVPASTGIGASNPAGAALVAGLIAVKPRSGAVMARAADSPRQGSAMDYRSSFSRAVEVRAPDGRTLYISGTASIDKEGRSVHIGDPQRQIEETMEVVSAILEASRMTWRDASRGVVYYPDAAHHELFLDYCRKNRIPDFPLSILESDVCRKELLFEIELDAVAFTAAM